MLRPADGVLLPSLSAPNNAENMDHLSPSRVLQLHVQHFQIRHLSVQPWLSYETILSPSTWVGDPRLLGLDGTRWRSRRRRIIGAFARLVLSLRDIGGLLVGACLGGAGGRLVHRRSRRSRIVHRWGHGVHVVVVLLRGVRVHIRGLGPISWVDLGQLSAGNEELRTVSVCLRRKYARIEGGSYSVVS